MERVGVFFALSTVPQVVCVLPTCNPVRNQETNPNDDEVWIPKAGLTAAAFQLYVCTVALESDWFEFKLTGRDVE